jgi:chromosome segregation ATPase
MSEQAPEAALEAVEAEQPEPFDPERAAAKIKKANDEARSLRQRLKELEPLAQEAERKREADKTEAERTAQHVAALEARAQEAEARAARLEVAAEKGLTPAQAKRLVGTTREELEADADELLATFKPVEPPRASLDLGPRNAPRQVDDSPRGLIVAGLEASTKR